jgi:hypothetical protein
MTDLSERVLNNSVCFNLKKHLLGDWVEWQVWVEVVSKRESHAKYTLAS